MESLLWALDLGAVVFLCIWALRQEKAMEKALKDEERKHA